MSQEINFQELIQIEYVNKTCDLLICIPTFNSFDITKDTIQSFISQVGLKSDILVTGPSGDIDKLRVLFPQINYVLTKDNYGSSGNQLINIFIVKKYGYKYFLLNDNDAKFKENTSLVKMLNNLKKNNLLVTYPILISQKFGIESKKFAFCTFHCCLYNSEILNKIESYFDFNYFLFFDDTSFLIKLKKFKDRIQATEVYFVHPEKPTKFFNYLSMFFFTRSYFNFMFYEKVSIWQKIYYLFLFRPYYLIPMYFLYSILNFDFSYFSIFFQALFQVLTKKYNIPNLSSSMIKYEVILKPLNQGAYKKFSLFTDIIFPKTYIKFLNEKSEFVYLKLIK
jgi:GT2 family glycosyltransferase